ncbi:hypothetical protein HJC23_009804 [Cyclotella cryptica]|uniref:Disease resistance R13L4/SHOC-2-like LRR domain-containing protein n=1 Tax=Cyclotella cryptica TaxID=29204 RepID=A0ABD3PRM4_9STRA
MRHLDLSFNQLQLLPDEISSLYFLQVLNCSCNKLQALPEGIASLECLAVLKANGNALTSIPSSIGQCKALKQLILSENILTSLPQEISGCTRLELLLLQNNDLCRLPLSLASMSDNLREMDVSNNNHQLATNIPIETHRDVNSIMWILALQQEKRHCIDNLKKDSSKTQHDIVVYEGELLEAEQRIATLEEKKKSVQYDLESVKYFLIAREHKRNMQSWMEEKWKEIKRACTSKLQVDSL